MKIKYLFTVLIAGFLAVFTSCEKDEPIPEEQENPYELEVGWNGFAIDGIEYATPNAIIEIWGETDSLSADFDVYFTDGIFNPLIRAVTDYSILVYFDANSPSLDELSTGVYFYNFTNSPERLPNKIVDAYIIFPNNSGTPTTYRINTGTVTVSENDGFFLVEYILEVYIDNNPNPIDIDGQYTGFFQLVDQRIQD